jgi:hypothetical protein
MRLAGCISHAAAYDKRGLPRVRTVEAALSIRMHETTMLFELTAGTVIT